MERPGRVQFRRRVLRQGDPALGRVLGFQHPDRHITDEGDGTVVLDVAQRQDRVGLGVGLGAGFAVGLGVGCEYTPVLVTSASIATPDVIDKNRFIFSP